MRRPGPTAYFCCASRGAVGSPVKYLCLEIDHAAVGCFWDMLGDFSARDALPESDAGSLIHGAVCRILALRADDALIFDNCESYPHECRWFSVTCLLDAARSDSLVRIEQVRLTRRDRMFVIVGEESIGRGTFESAPVDQRFLALAERTWARLRRSG